MFLLMITLKLSLLLTLELVDLLLEFTALVEPDWLMDALTLRDAIAAAAS